MKKIIKVVPICFLFMCLSCLGTKERQTAIRSTARISDLHGSDENAVNKKPINNLALAYFKASGTEPFWNLELSEERIVLKTITDSIFTPYTKPIQAMGGNVTLYKLQTESSELTIKIIQSECANAMSGKTSPYTVHIEYKKTIEPAVRKIEGCGTYITDYRLNDIWILDKLNGKTVNKSNFKNDLPLIEINSTENTFTGYTGCNRMNGKLVYEKELVRFTDVATTRMICDQNNKENEFLNALQTVTNYKIENNFLYLFNLSQEVLLLKKID